jgi:hypothetical protein
MKYKIKTNIVAEEMQLSKSLDGFKTVTPNSLRDDGLTRTETDNLFNEEYEFQLRAICIIAKALLETPLKLVAEPEKLKANVPSATEKLDHSESIINNNQNHTHTQMTGSQQSFLLEALDSDKLKLEYLDAEESFDIQFGHSTRELREQASFAWGDHLSNKTRWINMLDPEVVMANKEAFELFQEQLEEYKNLRGTKTDKAKSLSELLKNSESAIKAKDITLKTTGEDYRIFYKAVFRDVFIEEEAINRGPDFDSDYPINDHYHRKPIYKFEFRPMILEHYFIIAPSESEHFLMTVFSKRKEKHVFDLSKEQTPLWATDIWWTDWNEAGGIGPMEDEDDDIPF